MELLYKTCMLLVKVKLTSFSNADEVVKEIFQSLINTYDELDKMMKISGFSFKFFGNSNSTCKNVNVPGGLSFIVSPNLVEIQKCHINLQNNDDRCFQYALKLRQHYEEIKNYHGRVKNIKAFNDHFT